MIFDSVSQELSVPERKAKELLLLLDSLLSRADSKQSVSCHELELMAGKLMWASSAVEIGRAYLRQMRKPAVAVTDLLTTRSARERFCIPLWHFGKAVDELRWWRRALE
eukprot:2587195-Rhodomonas_salina.1